MDDGGQSWRAILAERPVGWIAVPTGAKGVLCPSCVAAWLDAARIFMIPPSFQQLNNAISTLEESAETGPDASAAELGSSDDDTSTEPAHQKTPIGIGSTATHLTRNRPE